MSTQNRKQLILSRLKAKGLSVDSLTMGEDFVAEKLYIPTGIFEVDQCLGDYPGIPEGTVAEFSGQNRSGKSFLAYHLIAEAQKLGKRCALINVENAFYPKRAEQIGIKLDDDLLEVYSNMSSAEEYGEWTKDLIRTKEYALIVVDSVTAMIPKVELERTLYDPSKIGSHAAFIGRLVKELCNICAKTGTICILINQLRYGAGAMPNTMVLKPTGGESIGFYAHVRLFMKGIGGVAGRIFDSDKKIIGNKSEITFKKNRYGVSGDWVKCEMKVMFEETIPDPAMEFIEKCKSQRFELIKEVRKVFKYVDENTGEVIENKDLKIFLKDLINLPPPEKRSKKDNSVNTFEYLCNKIKLSDQSKQLLYLQIEDNKDLIYEIPEELNPEELNLEE